jgi:cyanate lyase
MLFLISINLSLLGQVILTLKQADIISVLPDLPDEAKIQLQLVPYKGSLSTALPTDPVIYRFYEFTM